MSNSVGNPTGISGWRRPPPGVTPTRPGGSVASASTPRRFRSDLSEALSPGSELATAPEAPWPALAWFLAANADYAPAHALPRLLRYGLVLLALQTAHAHRCVPLPRASDRAHLPPPCLPQGGGGKRSKSRAVAVHRDWVRGTLPRALGGA